MKLSFSALSLALLPAVSVAFTTAPQQGVVVRSSLSAATLDTPPTREPPGAGWEPEWENRPGLTPEEFMKSDMSKPDLSGMWECPLTRWNSEG